MLAVLGGDPARTRTRPTETAMTDRTAFHVTLQWTGRYQFLASFEDLEDRMPLLVDEPPPLGDGHGPSAAALLAAAVGQSLAASLLLCLQKMRTAVAGLTTRVTVHLGPGDADRLQVERLSVELCPQVAEADVAHVARCQEVCEEFCAITAAVRRGLPVDVTLRVTSRAT